MVIPLFIFLFFLFDDKPQSIEGIVVNQKGRPVVGANLYFKRTNQGTVTDECGYFSFTYDIFPSDTLIIGGLFERYYDVSIKEFKVDQINLICLKEVLTNDRRNKNCKNSKKKHRIEIPK